MASDFLGSFPDCVRTRWHHNCLWQTRCQSPGRRMGSPPTCPPHTHTLGDIHRETAPHTADANRITQIQLLTNTVSFSFWKHLFCSALQRGWGRSCRRKPPPHPQFREPPGALEGWGLVREPAWLGLHWFLIILYGGSLWGGPRTRRRLGSSKFQEAHPSLVQATINIWG